MQETQEMLVQSLGQEDPLEEEMATQSGILAWKILWTEKPSGLQSMGSQRVRHNWVCTHTHSWTGRITTVKITVLPNTIYRFNGTFHRITTNNSKICMETTKPQIAKTIWQRRAKLEVSCSLISKCTTKRRSSKVWYKNRKTEQCNRIELEINPCTHDQLIYDKEDKNMQWGKDNLFYKSC